MLSFENYQELHSFIINHFLNLYLPNLEKGIYFLFLTIQILIYNF